MLESPCVERREILLPPLETVDRDGGLGDHAPGEHHGVLSVGDGAGIAGYRQFQLPQLF